MKVVKLTKKAQDIVNQIMTADAVDVHHGPIFDRVYYGNIYFTGEGLKCNVIADGEISEIIITNETLNAAKVVDGVIVIDSDNIKDNQYGDMIFTLYKLSELAAV